MGLSSLLSGQLRKDPYHSRLAPLIPLLCILVGIVWLLVLPLDDYSRRTYISENAILPGQVHTYFGGSDHNVFRAYRKEVERLEDASAEETAARLAEILQSIGLRTAIQHFSFDAPGLNISGQNVYSHLVAPRGDATEGMVLVAPWRNGDGELNRSGVALLLTLARYFKRWSIWSKDILFLIPPDTLSGPQAWTDAYHRPQPPHSSIGNLPFKAGALQAALVLDYPGSEPFEGVHVLYDGLNGQLPNLDLINTAFQVAASQINLATSLQGMHAHDDSYGDRLQTMLRGMMHQALGRATGAHSSFVRYRIDAITLQAVGRGWHDEGSLGRTVESVFRSVNNLLEHLHQSFFLYLLMQPYRFVSIGTYLPSALLLASSFSLSAFLLWLRSGSASGAMVGGAEQDESISSADSEETSMEEREVTGRARSVAIATKESSSSVQRSITLPLSIVIAIHALGLVPLWLLNNSPITLLQPLAFSIALSSVLLPKLISISLRLLPNRSHATSSKHSIRSDNNSLPQIRTLISCFSLILLGIALSALATVNFSLAFVAALLASPLSFTHHIPIHSPIPAPAERRQRLPTAKAQEQMQRPAEGPASQAGPESESESAPESASAATSISRRIITFAAARILDLLNPVVVLWLLTVRNTHVDLDQVLAESALAWHVSGVRTGLVLWCVYWPSLIIGGAVLQEDWGR